jgi:Sec7-like guanine-nucleotide exchange factor
VIAKEHQLALFCILEAPASNLSQESGWCDPFLWVFKVASKKFQDISFNMHRQFSLLPSKFIIHSQYLIEHHSKPMHLTEFHELIKTQHVDNQACSERGVDSDK